MEVAATAIGTGGTNIAARRTGTDETVHIGREGIAGVDILLFDVEERAPVRGGRSGREGHRAIGTGRPTGPAVLRQPHGRRRVAVVAGTRRETETQGNPQHGQIGGSDVDTVFLRTIDRVAVQVRTAGGVHHQHIALLPLHLAVPGIHAVVVGRTLRAAVELVRATSAVAANGITAPVRAAPILPRRRRWGRSGR